ncbi:hypothetical protein GCM10010442_01400 [Kitasatospora kifunensis]
MNGGPGRAPFTVQPPSFGANNNRNAVVVQAGGDATLHLHQRRLLPTRPIAPSEISSARQAWVKVDPQGQPLTIAVQLHDVIALKGHGLAVIAGDPGSGRSGAAVKALVLFAEGRRRADPKSQVRLEQITPDWDPPDPDLLPADANCGYLLDVSTEISDWKNRADLTSRLISHGRTLAGIGSCLILITDRDSWPTVGASAEHLVDAVRPSPFLLCATHLTALHHRSDLAQQLDPAFEPAEGEIRLANLIKEGMHPADAAGLARLLAATDGSPKSLENAIETFEGWTSRIKDVFDSSRDSPEDRALLLSAVVLEGASPATVQKGARRLLGEKAESDVRRILSGLDLGSRLLAIGAETSDNKVSFAHRPGYGAAVLRHVWTQIADVQEPLKEWLKTITASGGEGADRLERIADLLAELAVSEQDLSILPSPLNGTSKEPAPLSRGAVAARMLATVAQEPAFGATVRTELRERWAKSPDSAVAQVAALVCQGPFAVKYPRQALVRLRWILRRPDEDSAVRDALQAVRLMAANPRLLPEVWTTVTGWTAQSDSGAGRRAFLALIDPAPGPGVLRTLVQNAEQDPRVTEELVAGWRHLLSDTTMAAACERLFAAWAQAAFDGNVPSEVLVGILDQVVTGHLRASPVSAFLMGRAGVGYPPAVIAMRGQLMERRGFTPVLPEQKSQEAAAL